MRILPWTLAGAAGEAIRADAVLPPRPPVAVAVIAHGFKGYKDYGFLPVLALELMAQCRMAAHRFNFSHSGIGDDPSTFQRPDLFQRDTWNKQVYDLGVVLDAALAGELPGTPPGLPVVVIGHSRGGTACLLFAGRRFRDGVEKTPAMVVTISAPASACAMSEEQRRTLLGQGWLESPSSRTGQALRVGRAWLQEQIEAPDDHDVLALREHIRCPVLAMHGEDDDVVPAQAAHEISGERSTVPPVIVRGADHVWNTPNPVDLDSPRSSELQVLIDALRMHLSLSGVLAGR